MLGRYRLLARIGHGGMADVYLAVTEGPGGFTKLLVIKELRQPLARDPAFLGMFLNEARLASRLSHPNVVQTYEVSSVGERVFIAMEYLEGQPLHRVLARSGQSADLSLAARLVILSELLDGLHYAHTLKDYDGAPLSVVHRDVSPHNAFITYDGQIKIVDFGIAKACDSWNETRVGVLKGKIGYMAPEQARGEAVDARADVYSVGVILWEMITGQRMWSGKGETAILTRLVVGDIPSVKSVRPELPGELAALTARACAPNRELRFRGAAEFRDAIVEYLDARSLRVSPRDIGADVATLFAKERAELGTVVQSQLRSLEHGTFSKGIAIPVLPSWDEPRSGSSAVEAPAESFAQAPPTRRGRSWPSLSVAATTHSRFFPSLDEPLPAFRRSRWPHWVLGATATVLLLAIGSLARHIWPQVELLGEARRPTGTEPLATGEIRAASNLPAPSLALSRCGEQQRPLVELTGEIDHSATLTCDRDYLLRFTAFVTPGTTLSIEKGTRILGDIATKGTLVVQPGGRIVAEGTQAEPIVFTSNAIEQEKKPGDWGGVLILGRAPINLRGARGGPAVGRVEGITSGGDYGGDLPDDDSGVLRYVRIEYSGTELGPNNEINGLTLAGVGNKTRLDHIQVRHAADDCFEFFGGTVDATHLVCQAPGDDGIDWDYGYVGRIQFALVAFTPGREAAGSGIEADNDPDGSANTPISAPKLYNLTLCGSGKQRPDDHYGIVVRRGTRGKLGNMVVSSFAAGLDVRDRSTRVAIHSSNFFDNRKANVAYREAVGIAAEPLKDDDGGFDEIAWLSEPSQHVSEVDPGIDCAKGRYAPSSPVTQGAASPPDDGFFEHAARFEGAFRDTNDRWLEGWTEWSVAPSLAAPPAPSSG